MKTTFRNLKITVDDALFNECTEFWTRMQKRDSIIDAMLTLGKTFLYPFALINMVLLCFALPAYYHDTHMLKFAFCFIGIILVFATGFRHIDLFIKDTLPSSNHYQNKEQYEVMSKWWYCFSERTVKLIYDQGGLYERSGKDELELVNLLNEENQTVFNSNYNCKDFTVMWNERKDGLIFVPAGTVKPKFEMSLSS